MTLERLRSGAVRPPADGTVSVLVGRLGSKYPELHRHRTAFERLGSQFTFLSETTGGTTSELLFCLLRFSQGMETVFGLTREVAIYYSPYDDLQTRTLSHIRDHLKDNPRDVTPDLVFLSAPDPDLVRKCDEWSTPRLTIIPLASCDGMTPSACATSIAETMSARIFRRDLFSETAPVFGPNFFGRQLVLDSIKEDIRSQTAAAIFGLRKTGKTSLLYQLRHDLSGDPDSHVVFILQDLESLPPPDKHPMDELIPDLVENILGFTSALSLPSDGLESLPAHPKISEFKRAILRLIRDNPNELQVVIALDEIEYLCPPEETTKSFPGAEEIPRFLGSLRSIQQETDQFTFLLAGLGTSIIDSSQLYGRTNPIFAWTKKYFLSPFSRDEARELVRVIGYRMGTEWDDASIEELYLLTHGHPFLLRSLASAVTATLPIQPKRRKVYRSHLQRVAPSWKRSVAATKEAMLLDFRRHYPDAWDLIDLAESDPDSFSAYADLVPDALEQLLGLGLFVRVDRSQCAPTDLLTVLRQAS